MLLETGAVSSIGNVIGRRVGNRPRGLPVGTVTDPFLDERVTISHRQRELERLAGQSGDFDHVEKGDAFIVLEEDVENFVNKLSKQKGSSVDYRVIATADHFFREKMDELIQNLDEYISEKLTNVKSVKTKNDRRRRQVQPIAE